MPVRIYDISKKLGLENKQVLAKAKELGIAAARVASSSLDKITAEYLEQQLIVAHPEIATQAAAAAAPAAAAPNRSEEAITIVRAPETETAVEEPATATATSVIAPETAPAEVHGEIGGNDVRAELGAPPAEPEKAAPPPPPPPPEPAGPRVGDKIGFIQLPTRPAPKPADKTPPRPPARPGDSRGPTEFVRRGDIRDVRPAQRAPGGPFGGGPARGTTPGPARPGQKAAAKAEAGAP